MKARRWFALLLSAALAVTTAASDAVWAEGTDGFDTAYVQDTTEVTGIFSDLPDNGALFAGYVEEAFLGEDSVSVYGELAEGRLTGTDQKAYEVLKRGIQQIAEGGQPDTRITVSLEELGVTKTAWSAEELGVDSIVEGNAITREAVTAWMVQNTPDINKVLSYLMVDCPFELYWFDKTVGVSVSGPQMGASSQDGENWLLSPKSGITYQFCVAEDYRDDSADSPEYAVDASLPQTVRQAADRAKEIAAKYAGYGDREKLAAFRQEICDLTSYNHEAASTEGTAYGNPWQLVWVFDGDASTSVVCEGYAKAFQYLCDLSRFESPELRCYTVSGVMAGGTGAGGHMWNIVTMDDGRNYIADITNCDTGTVGADGGLFLAAAGGSVQNGYTVQAAGQQVSYRYDAHMPGMYGDILEISPSAYTAGQPGDDNPTYGVYGENVTWNLSLDGTLALDGAGALPDAEKAEDVPWHPYRSQIKRVTVGEGIIHIGKMAFYECRNLEEAVLPDSLLTIGSLTFSFCGKLKKLTLGSQITRIGDLGFMECKSLTELSLPATLAYLGNQVFYRCQALKDIWFAGPCPAFENKDVFQYTAVTLHYPSEQREGWDRLKNSWSGVTNVSFSAYCADHVWEAGYRVDKNAGCTAPGLQSIHCTLCDEVKDQKEIPATGHQYATSVTKATTVKPGGIVKRCSVCGEAFSTVLYSPKTVTLAKETYTYSGKELSPAVTVTDSRGNEISASDYTVSYSGNRAVGTALATVTFRGNYEGTLSASFVINPKGTSLSKLKGKPKKIEVKWKKQTAQTSGYQIQYALKSNFKGAKTIKAAKPKTQSKTVSKLKARKKYYVRIRTYKTVQGKTYYSEWSKAKSVRTK